MWCPYDGPYDVQRAVATVSIRSETAAYNALTEARTASQHPQPVEADTASLTTAISWG